MRILYAHEFDPAGVHIGHREALRAAGIECYVASRQAYLHRSDFDTSLPGDPDVIVVCPGVGKGQSEWDNQTLPDDGHGRKTWTILPEWVEEQLTRYPNAKRVALIHGSANTMSWWREYRQHWQHERLFTLAATTLDYATRFNCAWLPPAVGLEEIPANARAQQRKDEEPLFVVQAPTDPKLCHMWDFVAESRAATVAYAVIGHLSHHRCLWLKTRFHAGFDHFRGAFSVNTIENAALGLVPIFSLRDECRTRGQQEGLHFPHAIVNSSPELRELLKKLQASPAMTREYQSEGQTWYYEHFTRWWVARLLKSFYEKVLS